LSGSNVRHQLLLSRRIQKCRFCFRFKKLPSKIKARSPVAIYHVKKDRQRGAGFSVWARSTHTISTQQYPNPKWHSAFLIKCAEANLDSY
jgi:hypothetical protein